MNKRIFIPVRNYRKLMTQFLLTTDTMLKNINLT